MEHQCAWCLRLINRRGERTSDSPLPKMYEASHGICKVCGILWLEALGESNGNPGTMVIENKTKDLFSLAGGKC
jgi:hypothetical protein